MIVASTFSRREMLRRVGLASAAAIALPELSRVLLFQRSVLAREQAPGGGQTPTPTLTSPELATLGAVCARIIPTDDNGPGATEAIHEAVLAIRARIPIGVLADTIHAFPTTARVLGGLFVEAARELGLQ